MDKIEKYTKKLLPHLIVHSITTQDGLDYQVLHWLKKKEFVESIFFLSDVGPVLLRRVTLPLSARVTPDFRRFIEGDRISN